MKKLIKSFQIKTFHALFILVILFFSLSPVLADELPSKSSTGTNTCTDQTFTEVTSTNSMDVTNVNAVYVAVSFTTKMAASTGTETRTGYYKIIATDAITGESGEISRRLVSVDESDDKGIGSLVHIFDVSAVTGSVTFTFQHKNGEAGELITTGANLVAIGLTTEPGTQHLDYDVQRVETIDTDSLAVDTTWTTVSETAAITNPAGGNLFIASSINSKKDNALGAVTAQGEWKFQYKQGSGGDWFDLGASMSRSFADENSIGMTGTVSVMENQSSADFYFRLLNRLANLTSDTVVTFNTNLVAFTLGTSSDGKTFPVYKVEGGPSTTTSTSMVTALTKSITPSNAANLYLHSQYSMSADAASNAPAFDLFVDNSIYDGLDQYRAISGASSTGSGMSVGLATGLIASTTYTMSLRHLSSSSGITLTTDDIALIGIQLSHNNEIVWNGSSSSAWNLDANWTGGIPTSSDNVIIPNVTTDPIVSGTRTCYDLTVQSGAVLTVSGSGDLTVEGNLTTQGTVTVSATLDVSGSVNVSGGTLNVNDPGVVTITNHLTTSGTVNVNSELYVTKSAKVEGGKLTVTSPGLFTIRYDYLWIAGGELELNSGRIDAHRYFYTETGCTVNINGGIFDIFWSWYSMSYYARGNIGLHGGSINMSSRCYFSNWSSKLTGTMDGPFTMTIAGDLRMTDGNWTVSDGTIILTGDATSTIEVYADNDENLVAYNLELNSSTGKTFYLCRPDETQGIRVINDFTITKGTVITHNGTGHNDDLSVGGTFTLGADAHFKDAIESTDTYSVGSYSLNAASIYEFNGTTQNIPEATFGNLTVSTAGTKSLLGSATVAGDLTVSAGVLHINSTSESNSGSLIVDGTSTGNITYNRYMTGVDKWHLISAPIGGQSINTFVTTSGNNIATQSPKYGLAPYDNSIPNWYHYNSSGDNLATDAGNFVAGKGYEVLSTANGTVDFTGTVATADVSIGLTTPTSPGTPWNLVGNPFPSAIHTNELADASNNFLTVNTADLDDFYEAIYVWDANAVTPDYITINQSSAATYIAPGQAFFVYSAAGGGKTADFTEVMQTHQTGDIFKSGEISTPSIKLIAERSKGISSTNIKYIENMTTGLDPGYDAGRFSGGDNSFAVYTHLVGDETNTVDFDIQCLPANEYTHVIPIGLNTPENSEVVFRTEAMNLPLDVPVYLEDREKGTFTDLSESGSFYSVNITDKTEGTGRFYLHTQKSATTGIGGIGNEMQLTIIPRPQNNLIRVIGNVGKKAQLDVFDLAGRKLMNTNLNNAEINDVEMNGFNSGVYIIHINSSTQKTSKKISWIK